MSMLSRIARGRLSSACWPCIRSHLFYRLCC
uniref:Uncharacterized protein n=1 Tax=Arundo donax TaxID=35708 RepID=A0A0A9FRP1_ARUDO